MRIAGASTTATGAATRRHADGRAALPWELLLVTAVAWLALAAWSSSTQVHWLDHAYQPATPSAQVAAVAVYALAWALMTLAMMLPATATLLGAFSRVVHARDRQVWLRAVMVGGFLGTWVAVGCAFRALDGGMHAIVDALPWLRAHPEVIPASGLVIAGGFQFTAIKRRCLAACRSPASFIYRRWGRSGAMRDALAVGAAFGRSCVGCCWALMLVMFASSMTSLGLMVALTGLMAAERLRRVGDLVIRPAGAVLIVVGLIVATGGDVT